MKTKPRKKYSHRRPKSFKSRKKFTPEDKYSTKFYARKATEIILNNKKGKPFFIYLPLFTKSYPWLVDFKMGTKRKKSKKKHRLAMQRDHVNKITEIDLAMSDIVKALKRTGQYHNTVIIFISDNGGKGRKDGARQNNQNYPLRGSKGSMYEGGTKVPGFIHSPIFSNSSSR